MSRPIKAAAIMCALLMVFCCVAPPSVYAASPAILLPADNFSGTSGTTEGTTLYSFRFNRSAYFDCYNGSTFYNTYYGVMDWTVAPDCPFYRVSVSPLGTQTFDETASVMIDVRDFKVGAVLDLHFSAQLELDLYTGGSSNLTYITRSQMVLYWFDTDFNLISSDTSTVVEKECVYGEPYTAWVLQNSFDMSIPEDATYMVPRFVSQIYDPAEGDILRISNYGSYYFDVVIEKDDINADSLTLESIEKQLGELNESVDDTNEKLDDANEKLDDTNEKLDDTNEKLDQIIEQPENEKEEASNEGAELADQLTGALPNESQGFMSAIKELADAMSYDGTEAKMTFPAISLPAIPGVMKGYKLSVEYEVDFSYWIQKMPNAILTLVQVVLTISLVVYCFKELYGMISYAMTLKGGGE